MATEPQAAFDFERPLPPNLDGETYEPQIDGARLGLQMERVLMLLQRGKWMSLAGMKKVLEAMYAPAKFPEQSVSARVRDFRKKKFGGYKIPKRRTKSAGLWQYRMVTK